MLTRFVRDSRMQGYTNEHSENIMLPAALRVGEGIKIGC